MSDFQPIADEIVKKELAAYFVSPRPMSARISAEPFDLRLAIAEALRAARAEGLAGNDSYSLISQAVHAKGVLDCTDFEKGPVVRRVLGQLAKTEDGCVIGEGCTVFSKDGRPVVFKLPHDDAIAYSTREAAEAARGKVG